MTPAKAGLHTRVHKSVLAAAEKRVLVWIAARLPASIHSDHLSGLALVAMAFGGVCFAALPGRRWALSGVVLCLALNWLGDSLDGTVARVRNHQRPRYGFYVDHVIDLAGTAMLCAGMACSELMSPIVALVLLAAYLLVSAESYLATHAAGVFRLSFLGFGPTELRILLAIGATRAAVTPWVSVGAFQARLFDVGGGVAIVGLLLAFLVSSVRNARALFIAEPLPARTRQSSTA